ncbi:hypothetical protein FEQ02_03059 [Burkholderia pseudomultivorans]|uniref:Uncharacterized protein n=1 Tax=Burkholderia pseudomultivorans TaxID=1207504 RepID=A0ABU2EA63_9BURK|nr:hypothetical protein [Burkholderia pseudomultivorans]MDR8734478.1 hypothetical protein [Burkholderia pseudomultivorans]MDR8739218.1 hypothetical protein [Burkholderia pseudomultivorans]MDR8756765.1 hypothetical protein [Burkholderia pseudomultivorans]MDR8775554.1 hypothetical protein [Burkholderia pseudomultivorans]
MRIDPAKPADARRANPRVAGYARTPRGGPSVMRAETHQLRARQTG